LIYTDDCSEARDRKGDMFGVRRVGESLLRYAPEGAGAVAEGLCRDVDAFALGEEQADDLTVLVVEYRGER